MKTETIINGSPKFNLTDSLEGRFLRQADGTLELAIVWGAETAVTTTLTQHLNSITQYLPHIQASNTDAVLQSLRLMKKQGWSYGGIATHLNLACLAHLTQLEANPAFAIGAATTLLKAVRVKDELIAYTLLPAWIGLQTGQLNWQDEPANNQRVRDALRQWKGKSDPAPTLVHPDMEPVAELIPSDIWRTYQKQAKRGK